MFHQKGIFALLLGIRNILILGLFLGQTVLYGQGELNVKVRREGRLTSFLQAYDNKKAPAVTSVNQEFPFLEEMTRVRKLYQESDTYGLENVFNLSFDSKKTEAELINQLMRSGAFEYVEPNYQRKIHGTTWTPTDDSTAVQWYHQFIQTFEAWELTRGAPSVKIGIIDTGLDYDHPEFEGQLAISTREDANGNGRFEPWPVQEIRNGLSGDFDGLDNDNNGFIDDVTGYDFTDQVRSPFFGDYLDPDPDPLDDNNHGTQVAGVVGAKADNQIGGVGIAPDCKLVVLRAFSALGLGNDNDIARAIVYAADNGIDILVMSFGDSFPSLTMQQAIKYAYDRGVVMVASAGNGTGDDLHYPSGFDEVISVSGTIFDEDRNEELFWPISSFGVTVDLAAPAEDIFTTFLREEDESGQTQAFGRIQGTSFAAPMVASAVGLLFSLRGKFSPRQVQGMLASTADDVSFEGWDHFTGAGRLNVFKLLSFSGSSTAEILSPSNDQGSFEDMVVITGSALDPEFESFSLSWEVGVNGNEDWTTLLEAQPYQVNADTLAVWDVSALEDGEYTLRLVINKTDGSTLEDRNRFVLDRTAPEVNISLAADSWDNEKRKILINYRSDDQALHTLHYRRIGEVNEKTLPFDDFTRNGHFLLGSENLSPGEYEMKISATNRAGRAGESAPFTINYTPSIIPIHGYSSLNYSLPNGRYLPGTYDFDKDGLQEVIFSKYDRSLSPGKIFIYEFNGSQFIAVDSLTFKSRLLPKDVGDTDQDGLLELFCSVNDSSFLVEQLTETAFPSEIIYENVGDTLFASRMADITGDGVPELFYKNFRDHFVYQRSGETFTEFLRLADISPDYRGSVSPRIVVEDFDNDGGPEMIFGDFDGDLIGYEYRNGVLEQHFLNIAGLSKSGNYVTAGDFDGDGQQEFLVASHTENNRNVDQERDTPFWWIRIFDIGSADTLESRWETYLYDRDSEVFNEATALNLDNDPAEEILFTNFPRAIIIEFEESLNDFQVKWFFKETLGTHHVTGDFNNNGLTEFGIGDPAGRSMVMFEQNAFIQGPATVNSLQGEVLGPTSISLSWLAVSSASRYRILRINDPFTNPSADTLAEITGTRFTDLNLLQEEEYAYQIISLNPSLTPTESGLGNVIILRPHSLPRLDSVGVIRANQLALYFSEPVEAREGDKARFLLNGSSTPISLIAKAQEDNVLLLGFSEDFIEGIQTIAVDSSWRDKWLAPINPSFSSLPFTYTRAVPENLILTRWEIGSDKEALLFFSQAVDPTTALDTLNYSLSPVGTITGIDLVGEDDDAVRITITEARIGALGYPLTITVNDVCTLEGVCISEEANTATFSSNKEDLSEVFVYPNPVRKHTAFEGVRFANLTQQALIKIYTVSGRYVNALEETDGDGGYEWDLRDVGNNRIKPGIYLFHVSTNKEGVEDFVGKFSVVE